MIAAISLLSLLALLFGLLLGYASVRFKVEGDPVVDQIEAILPQQQCGKCGYPGCRAYAEAIVQGEADINQCPPGGEVSILALADLLDCEPKPLSTEHGIEKQKMLAVIDESTCIGCTLCIQACPVDAILGAAKCMHTVIAEECTGCERCIAPCPVDCIKMVSIPLAVNTWKWPYPALPPTLQNPMEPVL
jgi:electron transport complex protein RnfB